MWESQDSVGQASPRPGAPRPSEAGCWVRVPQEDSPAGGTGARKARSSPSSAHSSAQGPQLCCVWASAGIRADSAVCPVPSTLASSPQGSLSLPRPGPPDLEKPLGVLRAGAPSRPGMGPGMVVLGDTGLYHWVGPPGWAEENRRAVFMTTFIPSTGRSHLCPCDLVTTPTPRTRATSSPVLPPAL